LLIVIFNFKLSLQKEMKASAARLELLSLPWTKI